ncbi:MAG: hypothetical protein ACRD8A_11210 [Candidatus Acidiferrales bacterium]
MAVSAPAAVATPRQLRDDAFTICGIAALASMLSDQLHEAVGHAAVALLAGAHSGVLSTVAWSSVYDSRLVEAGGTLVNVFAGLVFWIALRSARNASIHTRLFLFFSCAFNMFAGTGYFFFSGVTDFGDWAQVIAGLPRHALWRTLLVIVGIAAYYGAVWVVGIAFVRYLGVSLNEARRRWTIVLFGYFSAIVLAAAAAAPNPLGIMLMWESALPATAGAQSGLLWWQYYIPKKTAPARASSNVGRSYRWIAATVVCGAVFVFVLGRGIKL